MSAFKGTPGPWYLDGEGVRALVRDASGVIVAVRHRMPGHKNETNMRLIAAAPESHEANKLSLTVLCAIRAAGVLSHDTNILRDLDSAIGANRSAIAKATGEQI